MASNNLEFRLSKLEKLSDKLGKSVDKLKKDFAKNFNSIKKFEDSFNNSISKISELEKSFINQSKKITTIKKVLKTKKINIGEKLPGGSIKVKNTELQKTLKETNTILEEIQKQLTLDFSKRNSEEREKNERLKKEKSKSRFNLKESAIETTKKIGNFVKNQTGKILQPAKNLFDDLIKFISLIGAGIATNAVFEWLKDDENREKINEWFGWIKDHWQWGLVALGAVAALNLVGPISGLVKVLKVATGLIVNTLKVLTSPVGLAVIAGLALAAGAGVLGDHLRKLRKKQQLQTMVSTGTKDPSKIGGDDGMTFEEYKIFNYMEPGFEELQDATVDPRIERNRKRYEEVGPLGSTDYNPMDDTPQIIQREKTFGERLGDFFRPAQEFIYGGGREMGVPVIEGKAPELKGESPEARKMGGPISAEKPYLVGEEGPELIVPKISGTVINNTKTEKIYKMISSKNAGKVNFVTMDLPPQVMKTEKSIPSPPAPEVPNISSTNAADLWRNKTPDIYGIYV